MQTKTGDALDERSNAQDDSQTINDFSHLERDVNAEYSEKNADYEDTPDGHLKYRATKDTDEQRSGKFKK